MDHNQLVAQQQANDLKVLQEGLIFYGFVAVLIVALVVTGIVLVLRSSRKTEQ